MVSGKDFKSIVVPGLTPERPSKNPHQGHFATYSQQLSNEASEASARVLTHTVPFAHAGLVGSLFARHCPQCRPPY